MKTFNKWLESAAPIMTIGYHLNATYQGKYFMTIEFSKGMIQLRDCLPKFIRMVKTGFIRDMVPWDEIGWEIVPINVQGTDPSNYELMGFKAIEGGKIEDVPEARALIGDQ